MDLKRIADVFATGGPDPASLGDPAGWGSYALAVRALQRGDSPEDVLRWLPADLCMAVFAADPEGVNLPPLATVTARALLTTEYPEPTWVLPDLIPAGLVLLAGRPKVGKSWLALQVALAVATGGRLFDRRVEPGPVLVMPLEDSPRRLQDRMRRLGWQVGNAGECEFLLARDFRHQVGDLAIPAGVAKLAEQWRARRYRLVVIDTLSRALSGDQNDVAAMTAALSPLQVVAQEVNGCLLLLDHHRKTGGGDAADAILDVSGSTAKPAVADAVLGLYKEQGRAGAVLHATGRDIPEVRLRLAFDAVTGAWQCTGDADAAVIGDTKQRILDYLDSVGSASVRDVAEAVGLDKGNAHKRLSDLVAAGLVRRASDGKQGVRYGLSEARQLQQQRQL